MRELVPPARVERLRLFRFRNYGEATATLHPQINVVCGDNAQGKTNLLEAVATAALTHSPRAHSLADTISWGAEQAQLDVLCERGQTQRSLCLRLTRDPATRRVARTVWLDGNRTPAQEVLGLLPVVTFWPDDLLLVKTGPEARRHLLDVLLSQADRAAAQELLRYRRTLQQRNALLRLARGGQRPSALPAFTTQLVEHGARLRAARAALTLSLSRHATTLLPLLSSTAEDLGFAYVDSHGSPLSPLVAQEEATLSEALRRRATEEVAAGTTLAGPHRDDLEILLNGRPARTACSQGQQRSIVLACKLAEMAHLSITLGSVPVLLLDDVLSELDASRQRALLAALSTGPLLSLLAAASPPQVIITTNELSPALEGVLASAHRLDVRQGTIAGVEALS
ncbi:MAG TPA: DNA replication and repair protein RecF [Candidatus Sulfotelmatobacter sp.]|nr:DNA replication and repair protein RecF [Candidatus Sulfotelmatobacter sp.]